MTSTQAVAQVRRIFDAQKAGHAGTLDPLATGILAIALGEATKTVPYRPGRGEDLPLHRPAGAKRATATMPTARSPAPRDVRPSPEAIEAMLPRFTGALTQVPPAYSAIKVAGERAYDLAREGEEVTLEPRQVQVYEARLVERRAGPGGVRNPLWQRDLRPFLGARYGPGLGTLGHVSRAAADPVGALPGKRRGRAGNTDPFYA